MDSKLVQEVFSLTVEAQRIENRKWEIRRLFKPKDGVMAPSWDEVCTEAMKTKMEEIHVNCE